MGKIKKSNEACCAPINRVVGGPVRNGAAPCGATIVETFYCRHRETGAAVRVPVCAAHRAALAGSRTFRSIRIREGKR